MSDPVWIALISTVGVALISGIFAIITQKIAKATTTEQQKIKEVTASTNKIAALTKQENFDSFEELKVSIAAILEDVALLRDLIEDVKETNDLMMKDRLRQSLKFHLAEGSVPESEKDILVKLFKKYEEGGYNGTVKTMFKKFDDLPVT